MKSFEKIEQDALRDGFVWCKCYVCGKKTKLEPDADTGWCEKCKKVTAMTNPLFGEMFL